MNSEPRIVCCWKIDSGEVFGLEFLLPTLQELQRQLWRLVCLRQDGSGGLL